MKFNRINRRRFLRCAIYGAPALAVADSLWFEPQWLKVRRINLSPGKPAHRFVHFTDLHHKGDQKYLQSVVKQINKLSPEFVCFTGDIMEDTRFLDEALADLKGIKSPLFGIPGNHDYWSEADFDIIAPAFAATGGKWLVDESILTADGKVNIIGATCTKPPVVTLNAATRNIMLIHYPEWIEKLSAHKFDLALAGHSHGGQVRLPFYGPLVVPFGVGRYDLGLFQTPSGPLYVGAGIGWFYLDVRFNCRPEITVFEI